MKNNPILKKKKYLLAAAFLCASLVLGGCSSSDQKEQIEEETAVSTEKMTEQEALQTEQITEKEYIREDLSTKESEIVDLEKEYVDNESEADQTVHVNVMQEDELSIIVMEEGSDGAAVSDYAAESTLAGFGTGRKSETTEISGQLYTGEELETMSQMNDEGVSSTSDQLQSELMRRIYAAYLEQEEAAGAVWCIAYEGLGGAAVESISENISEAADKEETDPSVNAGSLEDAADGVTGYQEDRTVLSASVIKVFIMGAVYDRICYPAEEMEPIGYSESYDGELGELLQQMITVSSNEAANRLVEILGGGSFETGMQVVNDFCERHGYTHTSLGRRFLGSNEYGDNYVSASDCRQILSDIYYGKLVNEEASLKMLNRLKEQTVTHKIPSGLPEGFTSANKTGEMPEGYGLGCIENDMAIVFTPYGDYILVILSSELNGRNSEAQTTISGISALTAQYYLEQQG